LGAGATCPFHTDGAGEHQVDDVLGEIVLPTGDEPLDAFDVPRAVFLRIRLGAAGADVGSGVGFGQHHRGGPLPLDHDLGDAFLRRGAVVPYDTGERRP